MGSENLKERVMGMKRFTLILVLGMAASPLASAQQKLTYVELVKRLTDLEHLATLPEPGETTKQWSSYDRASKYDAATGKYLRWDANGDNAGILRKEGDTEVFAEMKGPGCIWRIWSATAKEGHVKIYLNGASEPAVDLPFIEYFSGKQPPFTRPLLVHTTAANGYNNYTPIPYQKSCKIVADKGWGAYYQFVYTTFPKGTEVPTFKRGLGAKDNAALDNANKLLGNCGAFCPSFTGQGAKGTMEEFEFPEIPPGGKQESMYKGPAWITSMRLKIANLPAAPLDQDTLRALTLEISWDGETNASVWSPVGDFFGTAPGANSYQSWPCGLDSNGWWYSHWPMPFATNANVLLRNENSFPLKAKLVTQTRPIFGEPVGLARFHAKWHRDAFLPPEPERAVDWTMLKTSGRGRYVGVTLHIWNPRGGWWGEGDEKFFVDGEKFPSTIGTGSEDYFGYAWSSAKLFFHPYHNQTFNSGNCKGHISVNRWHVADQIPFQRCFDGFIEKYYPNAKPTLYASTVYWYLEPGGEDPYGPVPLHDRTGYFVQPVYQKIPGVIEGEQMRVLSKTGGDPQEQDMTAWGEKWSHDAQLWWINAKPGNELMLALPVEKAGKFKLLARLTKAVDYGIVQLILDGRKIGEPVDLYNDGVIPTGELDLGAYDLSAGEHKLTVLITGANEKAVKSYMFGLDYVKLVEAK
jgi:hypothetical protein